MPNHRLAISEIIWHLCVASHKRISLQLLMGCLFSKVSNGNLAKVIAPAYDPPDGYGYELHPQQVKEWIPKVTRHDVSSYNKDQTYNIC